MTFGQILNILWRRRLYIVVTVVLAFVVAAGFLQIQKPSYASTASIRFSSLATSAAKAGELGSTQVDFSPQSITLPSVLADAAVRSGAESGTELVKQVTYAINTGSATTGTSTSGLVDVTALGPSAASAKARVEGVTAAYNAYLLTQQEKALAAATAQQLQFTKNAETYQAQVTASPNNSIAESNLADALRNLGSVNTTISNITIAGPPVLTFIPADSGVRQGVGAMTALLVALACGVIAGIAIALIRDQFDTRLRGEAEIRSLTGIATLGELSLDRRVSRRKQRLPAADQRSSALTEDMRGLRLTLQVLLPPSHGIIVVTSVEPGDGKTFISANLALVWARAGKKVILVAGDLRRPGLGNYYGDAADGAGLAELLESAPIDGSPRVAEVEAHLKPTQFEGLRILPSGAEPSEPSDLLARPALDSVFGTLREMSDIVIVDSPPSMALVDATQLASSADGVVMVASIGRTKRDDLTATVRSLQSHGVVVLGGIANRSRRRIPKSYGHYYDSGSRAHAPSTANHDKKNEPVAPLQTTVEEVAEPDPTATVKALPAATGQVRSPRKTTRAKPVNRIVVPKDGDSRESAVGKSDRPRGDDDAA